MDRNQLKSFAKTLLSNQEYIRFKSALKSFKKNGCISDFCFVLVEMVNAPEKTEILVEAKKMLPKSKQSEFSKICRDLVNKKWTMAGTMPSHYGRQCTRNDDGHPSPAKRARHGDRKQLGNALKTGIYDRQHRKKPLTLQQLQVREEGPHFHERERPANRRPLHVPYQDENGLFNGETKQDDLQAKEFEKRKKMKVLRMERESSSVNYGFKILGDLFTEREIVVRQVDKDSIAERAGLHERDRITRINDIDCERARKSDILRLIKYENKLKLTVISTEPIKVTQNIKNVKERTVAIETNEVHDHNIKKVIVHTEEDGWMGCSIRGGIDYDCEVHVISVADGSPAASAGLRPGDIITEVNGVTLKGCTHVQAVNLILIASPPITFTIKNYVNRYDSGYQRVLQKPESQNGNNLPHTPLRIDSRRQRRLEQDASDMVPLQSLLWPTPPPPLPGHWYQNETPSAGACGVVGSPSALPLNTLHLDGTPPPPYTAELPQMHRVIQMGGTAIAKERNHGLSLPVESVMPYQNNSASMLQNEELTSEQSRESERDAVQHFTHKKAVSDQTEDNNASQLLNIETSSTRNFQIVLQDAETNDTSSIQACNNPEKDEIIVKPSSRLCLLEAIRNFNPVLLKPAKERNGSHTPGELLPSSQGNDSLEGDAEPVKRTESLVANNENDDADSNEADLRTIINQALMKRRADILDSSQESVNESYCSEWGL